MTQLSRFAAVALCSCAFGQVEFDLPSFAAPTVRIRSAFAKLAPLSAKARHARRSLIAEIERGGDRYELERRATVRLRQLAREIRAHLADREPVRADFESILATLEIKQHRVDATLTVTNREIRRCQLAIFELEEQLHRATQALRYACSARERSAARRKYKAVYRCYVRESKRYELLTHLCEGNECLRKGSRLLHRGYANAALDAEDVYARLDAEAELLELAASLRADKSAADARYRELLGRVSEPIAAVAKQLDSIEDQTQLMLEISAELDRDAAVLDPMLNEIGRIQTAFDDRHDPDALKREMEAIERDVDELLRNDPAPRSATSPPRKTN